MEQFDEEGVIAVVKDVLSRVAALKVDFPELYEKFEAPMMRTIGKAVLYAAGGKYIYTAETLKHAVDANFGQEMSELEKLKDMLNVRFDTDIFEENHTPKVMGYTYEREVKKMELRLKVISDRRVDLQNEVIELRRLYDLLDIMAGNITLGVIVTLLESILLN